MTHLEFFILFMLEVFILAGELINFSEKEDDNNE